MPENFSPFQPNSSERFLTLKAYVVVVVTMFIVFYSQYMVTGFGPIVGTLFVYGVPVVAITVFSGGSIVRSAFKNGRVAVKLGLSSFGMFELLGGLVGAVVLSMITYLYPDSESVLSRRNPVLNVPPRLGWVMIFTSMVIVGPAEEYIFRGFVYGALLRLYGQHHWLALALLSSVFFAAAHLYYALVYGVASLVAFVDLLAFSLAMSFTYYFSGGNLLVPALIHGLYDAAGFLAVAVSPSASNNMRGAMILAGLSVAVVLAARRLRRTSSA